MTGINWMIFLSGIIQRYCKCLLHTDALSATQAVEQVLDLVLP
jgi:hypothetical protein